MIICFISYENIDYGGRTLELLKVMSCLGDVYGVIRGSHNIETSENLKLVDATTTYREFVTIAFQIYKKNSTDILFLDNRKAALIGNILPISGSTKIIYDMRELRIPSEIKSLSSKFGCIPERRIISISDIVICASKERSEYVKKYYKCSNCLSYVNIRKLEFSRQYRSDFYDEKYSNIFGRDTFKIISTSGTSISRGNDRLVLAVKNTDYPIDLFLVGGSGTEPEGEEIINSIIQEYHLTNIHIVDMVMHDELKYLIRNCDCGVVNYHNKDTNNRLCASGKVYEFIFEGLPVITTSNPPLVRMTREYGIGCSGDNYEDLIMNMINNYAIYRASTIRMRDTISVEENNSALINEIKAIIGL